MCVLMVFLSVMCVFVLCVCVYCLLMCCVGVWCECVVLCVVCVCGVVMLNVVVVVCVVLFGYGVVEILCVCEFVDVLCVVVEDFGVEFGEIEMCGVCVSEMMLSVCGMYGEEDEDGVGERVVMLDGDAAKVLMLDLKLEMNEEGFEGVVFGVFMEKLRFGMLGEVVKSVVEAYERYWNLKSTTEADSYDVNEYVDFEYEGVKDVWDLG